MPISASFTSESVSEGHPDKVADQISDALLDAILAKDPTAHVAAETLVKTGMVFIAGEIQTHATVDMETIVRKTIRDIGYNHSDLGFDADSCAVLTAIGKQSPDIARGVKETSEREQGAGDQGLMFGYATNETESYMPAPIAYAHALMLQHAKVRHEKRLPWLRPDAKCQITLRYENGLPLFADVITFSAQHNPDISLANLKEAIMEEIIKPVLPASWLKANTRYFINATGRFVIGGPMGDCGLTGRKIIVDTYGGMAHHGGGAMSGKDPSKVDRSAAYAARYVAKNIVAAKLADRIEIQVAYAIGIANPVDISINTFGTHKVPEHKILALIEQHFDLSPKGIIRQLDLLRPIYLPTASYGHFGRNLPNFTWERTDLAETLRKEVF